MCIGERMDAQGMNEWGVDGCVGVRTDGCWIIGWGKGKLVDG